MKLANQTMNLYKAQATGNDFLIADHIKSPAPNLHRKDWAREVCDRHFGVGADGLVILEPSKTAAFAWDFYNSDGSEAEMCGNAARAVSLYYSKIHGAKSFSFLSRVGMVEAVVRSADDIEVELPAVRESELAISWGDGEFQFVDSGVPHAVVQVESLDRETELVEIAKIIKGMGRFRSRGTNVTFVKVVAANQLNTKTFERGVEGFTLSCGTGAIAAAFVHTRGQDDQRVQVRVPGGDLAVLWRKGKPHLIGPARLVAQVHLL